MTWRGFELIGTAPRQRKPYHGGAGRHAVETKKSPLGEETLKGGGAYPGVTVPAKTFQGLTQDPPDPPRPLLPPRPRLILFHLFPQWCRLPSGFNRQERGSSAGVCRHAADT